MPQDTGDNPWFNPAFFFLLGAIALIAYWAALDNTLLCDDYYLLGRDRLHMFGGGGLGDLSSLRWIFYAEYPVHLRPVVLSAWLLISHFFGVEPWPTHLMNIFLHAATAWLLFWLLTRLRAGRLAAALPALLFALTPIAPEAVTWSSGDVDLFPLFFLLLGLGSYAVFMESGRRLWYGASLLAMALALLSKEMAMTMVVMIPAMELMFGNVIRRAAPGSGPGDGRRRPLRQAAIRIAPFLVLFAGYLALRRAILGTLVQGSQLPSIEGGFANNPLFTITVLLAPFSNIYFSAGFIATAGVYTLLLLIVSLAQVVSGWSTADLARRRLWLFLLMVFVVSLGPVSSYLIGGLNPDLTRSHFLYMATAFLLSLLAVGLLDFGWRGKRRPLAGAIALVLLLPVYFWGLQTNNRYWEDAAMVESVILDEMVRILPEPPENARIYLVLEGETQAARIYWCKPMLQTAVRSNYNRYDIKVVQEGKSDRIEDVGDTRDGYLFIYDESINELRLEHPPQV